MRKLLQLLLRKPLTWMGNYLAASPKKEIVFASLTNLYQENKYAKSSRLKIINANLSKESFIVFSDQHKGNRSWADDFAICETNYTAALKEYEAKNFNFINLGDSEELWKFTIQEIIPKNEGAFAAEAAFQPKKYFKTFGNHDLLWKNKLDVELNLKNIFKMPLPVYEGIVIRDAKLDVDIFLTHGHQGDLLSDNNSFSTWVVAHLWMPLQRYLRININSASSDFTLRNKHNRMMYEWSSENKIILITGHTHQPIFASGRYFKHPSNNIPTAGTDAQLIPSYFNTGCCCFNDGDITGIEITGGKIRLIKWFNEEIKSEKKILEEISFESLLKDIRKVSS
ncbi:MAG: metallophosphoesterase [Ferruginibacter sp.]